MSDDPDADAVDVADAVDTANTATGDTGDRESAVVVVEPETPGNAGIIARMMKNFGIYDLRPVDPSPLDPDGEAYSFAGHAREDMLPDTTETILEEVVEGLHTVGMTAVSHEDSTQHVRYPFKTPVEIADSLESVETKIVFVFGHGGTGLDSEELAMLDEVCCIPVNDCYPVFDPGRAATLLIYELRRFTVEETQLPDVERERALETETEAVYRFFDELLDAMDYHKHKRTETSQMMRRLLGRAHPTEHEAATLTGASRWVTEAVHDPDRFRDDES